MYYTVLAAAFLAIVSAILWVWFPKATVHNPSQPRLEKTVSVGSKREALLVSSDLDLSGLTKRDLRQFTTYFDEGKPPHEFSYSTEVKFGQSVITECYEGRPGEFIINKLTPKLTGRRGQFDVLEIESTLLSFSVSGDGSSLFDFTMKMEMNGNKPSESLGTMHTREGAFTLKAEATILPDGDSILLETSGGFKSKEKSSH